LLRNLGHAAIDLSPRTIINPKRGYRYLTALASAAVKLPGGLALRAITTVEENPSAACRVEVT
jgi:hypothetical protein